MSNTRPFTEAHAIAAVDVAFIFSDEGLDSDGRESLAKQLEPSLDGFVRADRNSEAMVFQRKEDGDVAEEVHVHSHYVHSIILDYRGWTRTKEDVLRRLKPVAEAARDGRMRLAGLGLVFIDVFVNEKPETYSALEVFKPDCRWIPRSAFSLGSEWKNSISWVDEMVDLRIRAQLSIDADVQAFSEDSEQAHFTEIKHRQEILGNVSGDPAVEWSDERVEAKLDIAHQRNKEILIDFLAPEMSERIGLKELS